MRPVFQLAISGGLLLALAFGGLSSVSGQNKQPTRSSSAPEVRRLSFVIGGAVRIANGVSVGKVEDVVLNDSGCIDYVVVVYRDQYVAIPWTVVTVDFRQRIVTVDITEERFAAVPTFRRDEFSFLTKTEFTQKVHSVFAEKGALKPKPAGTKAESRKEEPQAAKSEPKAADAKAESPKGKPQAAKSEPQPEPAKAGVQEKPKVESPDKPKVQPKGKPRRRLQGQSDG